MPFIFQTHTNVSALRANNEDEIDAAKKAVEHGGLVVETMQPRAPALRMPVKPASQSMQPAAMKPDNAFSNVLLRTQTCAKQTAGSAPDQIKSIQKTISRQAARFISDLSAQNFQSINADKFVDLRLFFVTAYGNAFQKALANAVEDIPLVPSAHASRKKILTLTFKTLDAQFPIGRYEQDDEIARTFAWMNHLAKASISPPPKNFNDFLRGVVRFGDFAMKVVRVHLNLNKNAMPAFAPKFPFPFLRPVTQAAIEAMPMAPASLLPIMDKFSTQANTKTSASPPPLPPSLPPAEHQIGPLVAPMMPVTLSKPPAQPPVIWNNAPNVIKALNTMRKTGGNSSIHRKNRINLIATRMRHPYYL